MIPNMSAMGSAHMLGEGGGLAAAARRGRERIRQREEAAARAAAQNDTMSETTLAPQGSEGEHENASGNAKGTSSEKTAPEKSLEEREGLAKGKTFVYGEEENNVVKKHETSGFRKWVRKHIP